MTEVDATQLAQTLMLDMAYLAEQLERYRAFGEVRLTVATVEVLLKNYKIATTALAGSEPEPVVHPLLAGAEQLKAARESAEKQMADATAQVKAALAGATL